MVSRWYRPPEIILYEPEYNSEVDIWSLGCVAAEMVLSTTPYREMGIEAENRILFPGTACHPMSPCADDCSCKDAFEQRDQLEVIMDQLGYLTYADKSFISNSKTLQYLESKRDKDEVEKIKFDREFD